MNDDRDVHAAELLGMGCECEKAGRWEDAIAHYRDVLDLQPGHPAIRYFGHNNLGYCLIQLGRYAEAQLYCEAAILIDGRRHNAHKNLGLACHGLRRFAESAESFLEAARLMPGDARAMQHLRALLKAHPDVLAENPALGVALEEIAAGGGGATACPVH